MLEKNLYRAVVLAMVLLPATSLQAATVNSNSKIQLRLDRLERMIQNNSAHQLRSKIRRLQLENQELRSQLEEVGYQLERLQNRIRALNEDMDRRVLLLERKHIESLPAGDADPDTDNAAGNGQVEKTDDNEADQIEQEYLAQNAYQQAIDFLKARNYTAALKAFTTFMKQYPDSGYAPLAQYWLAESAYSLRQYQQAIAAYQHLIETYAQRSGKIAEAHLKIAYSYYEMGDETSAARKLKQLVTKYPRSTEAKQAKLLLKKLQL